MQIIHVHHILDKVFQAAARRPLTPFGLLPQVDADPLLQILYSGERTSQIGKRLGEPTWTSLCPSFISVDVAARMIQEDRFHCGFVDCVHCNNSIAQARQPWDIYIGKQSLCHTAAAVLAEWMLSGSLVPHNTAPRLHLLSSSIPPGIGIAFKLLPQLYQALCTHDFTSTSMEEDTNENRNGSDKANVNHNTKDLEVGDKDERKSGDSDDEVCLVMCKVLEALGEGGLAFLVNMKITVGTIVALPPPWRCCECIF